MLAQALYLFALCWLLAQVEIQIEGARGWAEGLPTWRWDHPFLLKLTNGKPVTGYHFYLTLFLIGMFHLPLAFTGYSNAVEARILSLYLLTTVTWDFQWFLWNPAWGLKRFLTERIWWFPSKLLGFPREYYLGVAGSALATFLLDPQALGQWLRLALWLATASVLSAAAAQLKRAPSR